MQEVFVAGVEEIADGERRVIEAGDYEIGVFRLGSDYFAWENKVPRRFKWI